MQFHTIPASCENILQRKDLGMIQAIWHTSQQITIDQGMIRASTAENNW